MSLVYGSSAGRIGDLCESRDVGYDGLPESIDLHFSPDQVEQFLRVSIFFMVLGKRKRETCAHII